MGRNVLNAAWAPPYKSRGGRSGGLAIRACGQPRRTRLAFSSNGRRVEAAVERLDLEAGRLDQALPLGAGQPPERDRVAGLERDVDPVVVPAWSIRWRIPFCSSHSPSFSTCAWLLLG